MEILTAKSRRRSTRLRVQIPLSVTSMDRRHPFASKCVALVVNPQGCGLRASQSLPVETPVLLSNLPGSGTVSGRVANCLPLGTDGKYFLIGVALYNPANVWGIANPPEDWNDASNAASGSDDEAGKAMVRNRGAWPYNLFSAQGEARPGRK